MKSLLFRNWKAKIFSLILAIIVWAMIKGRLDYFNPSPVPGSHSFESNNPSL